MNESSHAYCEAPTYVHYTETFYIIAGTKKYISVLLKGIFVNQPGPDVCRFNLGCSYTMGLINNDTPVVKELTKIFVD